MQQTRRLPLTLPSELYKRLEEQAVAEERDVVQQARVILRRALEKSQAMTEPPRP
jgi:hypothetical protein